MLRNEYIKAWKFRRRTETMLCLRKGTEKMHYILMLRSLTASQKAARLLERAGIFAVVAKAPQTANPEGCTYGVKIGAGNLDRAQALLRSAGITAEKIIRIDLSGNGDGRR